MLYDESDVFRILDKIKIYDKEVMHKINSNLSLGLFLIIIVLVALP